MLPDALSRRASVRPTLGYIQTEPNTRSALAVSVPRCRRAAYGAGPAPKIVYRDGSRASGACAAAAQREGGLRAACGQARARFDGDAEADLSREGRVERGREARRAVEPDITERFE